MPYLELILGLLIVLVGIRTLCWHLQCWQIREYRFDRMKAWLNTKDGKSYFVPWLSSGLLPRPILSGRIVLIFLLLLFTAFCFLAGFIALTASCGINDFYFPDTVPHCPNQSWWGIFVLLAWERTLWIQTILAVWLSNIPVRLKKLHLFAQAGRVIKTGDQNIVRIGITGSYGKSSTKELLVHLLQSEFGPDQVLFNPANNNTEVAIARLILKNKAFFAKSGKPKFLVIETGAYKKGEIATVAKMIAPQYSILTGLNQQHVELFGSIQNTREAKFELAEGTTQTVFFNGDNAYLQEIFADRSIKATNVPISFKVAQNVTAKSHQTDFSVYGQAFTLPWPGEFFVHNALLALELCREVGIDPKKLSQSLKTLVPLKRALSLSTHTQGFTVLRDTYSANPDGVLSAINHLKNFKGKKIFVSIPLRELGGHAPTVHQQIFEALKKLKATVYWEKTDFADMGKEVLGDDFVLLDQNFDQLKAEIKQLKKEDVVLLESKLSQKVLDSFK